MRCQDFERVLNERLDARGAVEPGIDRALDAHAAACASCRAVAARYQTLRAALLALGPPPAAPDGFADRFLEHWEAIRPRPARPWRLVRSAWPLAAAAAVLVAVLVDLRTGRIPARGPATSPPPVVEAIDPREVTDALADATSAAWDLALETSAPATRVGRDVIDAAVADDEGATPPADGVLSDPDVLRRMGERVNDGMRPLSGTARLAFEFLLGPASAAAAPAPARGI
jgi:hypothetical protein